MPSRNALALAALCLISTSGRQQVPGTRPTVTARARPAEPISPDSARAIVHAHLPSARITSQHLRHPNGRLIYAFRLRTTTHGALIRATVDAMTGRFSRLGMPVATARR